MKISNVFLISIAMLAMLSTSDAANEVSDNASKESVDPNQMAIHIDVWPKEILAGDCIYVLFSVENKSQEPLTIQPLELFESLTMDGITRVVTKRVPAIPMFEYLGNQTWGEFRRAPSRLGLDIVNIPPGETRLIFTDRYSETNRRNYSVKEEPIPFRIVNFSEKYASCVQLPWPTLNVNIRLQQEENILVTRFLHTNMEPILHFGKFGYYGKVETQSGPYTVQIFLPSIKIDIPANTDKNLPNLSAWREFEEKLSPGTLRDEIRLGRIQVQYLDGEKEAALNELRDWFAEMEPIQSMTLAASLCLPEGLEEESEKDELFKPVGTVKDEPEAHKHYMAMRREIDKIVSPYNTLPRRKLRDTNAY